MHYRIVKISPLQSMKAHGGCGCKGPHTHNHCTRRGRVASTTLGRFYTRGKTPVLIFLEAEGTPGPVWSWAEEMMEKHKERINLYRYGGRGKKEAVEINVVHGGLHEINK